jgi:beta-glucanase (GH16 family)
MKNILTILLAFSLLSNVNSQTIEIFDDFEGNGTIHWSAVECSIDTSFFNPLQNSTNPSSYTMEYRDNGGQYANVQFEVENNFDLSENYTFTLKIYVPSWGITGSQPNQISLKLQDRNLQEPWSTQTEIIKPIALDGWQTITFDFANDDYINLDPNSLPPIQRDDLNRVVIQVNGENNNDNVIAYIDDVYYDGNIVVNPVFDQLIWSDEFETNGAINATNWFHQTQLPAGGSWFNGEVQHYTNRTDNSIVENGKLMIIAKKETFNDQGVTKEYTSARLNSKFAFQYGKVEVRAKLPMGAGTWPAIWMLGKNIDEDGAYWDNMGYGNTPWPACGEIDIMEHWGSNQNYVQSAMHTPSSFGATINHGGQVINTASTAFHTYSLEWHPDKMVFAVDGNVHYTYQPEVFNADTWPFDADQYLLLNIAIEPSIDPGFLQDTMAIEYVRVYQQSTIANNDIAQIKDIHAYPNPVIDHINLKLPDPINEDVIVHWYNTTGKLVKTDKLSVAENIIAIDNINISEGIYFLQVINGNKIYNLEVLKR